MSFSGCCDGPAYKKLPGEAVRRWSWTHPPLLVLFSCNYNHFSFDEGQLVVVVRLAVIDRLHAPGFALPLHVQTLSVITGLLDFANIKNMLV